MIEVKAFMLGLLMLMLPADWTQTKTGCAAVANSAIPGGAPVEECTAVWTRGNQTLYAFVWKPLPPRDGGPMVEAESWPVTFLGQTSKIIRTKTFMGMDQEVFMAAVHVDAPASANILIYGRNMSLEDFKTAIENAQVQGAAPAP